MNRFQLAAVLPLTMMLGACTVVEQPNHPHNYPPSQTTTTTTTPATTTTSTTSTSTSSSTAASPTGEWQKLGERAVDGNGDRDVIAVGAARGTYRALMIRVEKSGIQMHSVNVVFSNGTTFQPKTRLVFNAGVTSNTIDLPGDLRAIDRVEFQYSDLPGGGKAVVELYGH